MLHTSTGWGWQKLPAEPVCFFNYLFIYLFFIYLFIYLFVYSFIYLGDKKNDI